MSSQAEKLTSEERTEIVLLLNNPEKLMEHYIEHKKQKLELARLKKRYFEYDADLERLRIL